MFPLPWGAILARLDVILASDPTLAGTVLLADSPLELPPDPSEQLTESNQLIVTSSHVAAAGDASSSHAAVMAAARIANAAANPSWNPSTVSSPPTLPRIMRTQSDSSRSSAPTPTETEPHSPTSDDHCSGRERYVDLILATPTFQRIPPERHKLIIRPWLLGLNDRRLLLVGLHVGVYGDYELGRATGSRGRSVSTKGRQCFKPNDSSDHSHGLRPFADLTIRILRQLEQTTGQSNSKKRRTSPTSSADARSSESPTKRQRSGTPLNMVTIPAAAANASSSSASFNSPTLVNSVPFAVGPHPFGKSVRSSHLDSIHDKFGKLPKSTAKKGTKAGNANKTSKSDQPCQPIRHHTGLYEVYGRFLLPTALILQHIRFKDTAVRLPTAVAYLRTCLKDQQDYKAGVGDFLVALLEFWILRHEVQETNAQNQITSASTAASSSSSSIPRAPLVDVHHLCTLLHHDGLPVPINPSMNPNDFVLELVRAGQLADRRDLNRLDEWITAQSEPNETGSTYTAPRSSNNLDVPMPAQTVTFGTFIPSSKRVPAVAFERSPAWVPDPHLLPSPPSISSNVRMNPIEFQSSHMIANHSNHAMIDSHTNESSHLWQSAAALPAMAGNVPNRTDLMMSPPPASFLSAIEPTSLAPQIAEDAMIGDNRDQSNLEPASSWMLASPPPPSGSQHVATPQGAILGSSSAFSAGLSFTALSRANTEESCDSLDQSMHIYLSPDQ